MKTQLLAISVFLAYIIGISCRICDQLYSYKEAEKCCIDERSSIITVNNSTELDKLTSKMTNANLMSTWVPIRRHGLSGFHWIDKNESIFPALSEIKSCGLFDKKKNAIIAEHCSRSIGHICEIQDCTDCKTLGWDSVVCQQAETSCLIFSCDNKNWYDARMTCRQKRQRLAVATSEPLKRALSRGDYACNHFWIGVRNTEWGPKKGESQPGIPLWDDNEPSDDGNCAALFVTGFSHKLRAGPCNKKRHVICGSIQYQPGNQEREPESEKHTSNLALISSLASVGAVLLIVIVVVVSIKVRPKLRRRFKPMKNDNEPEKDPLNPATLGVTATEDKIESKTDNKSPSGEENKLGGDEPDQIPVGGTKDMNRNEGGVQEEKFDFNERRQFWAKKQNNTAS